MNRVIFLIDGFNFYHSLISEGRFHKYKWIDYSELVKFFVTSKDQIVDIMYFTSYAFWDQEKKKRHKILIDALRLKGVKIVFGKFKMRDKECRICKSTYRIPEEKQTDINIAVKLLESAINDEFDTAILVTADSDLVPAVDALKRIFPAKRIGLLIPIGRSSIELENICDFKARVKEKHLKSSQLPDTIVLDSKKGIVLKKPLSWK
jgi:uncharacterized LabA/DUF88 family protein